MWDELVEELQTRREETTMVCEMTSCWSLELRWITYSEPSNDYTETGVHWRDLKHGRGAAGSSNGSGVGFPPRPSSSGCRRQWGPAAPKHVLPEQGWGLGHGGPPALLCSSSPPLSLHPAPSPAQTPGLSSLLLISPFLSHIRLHPSGFSNWWETLCSKISHLLNSVTSLLELFPVNDLTLSW